ARKPQRENSKRCAGQGHRASMFLVLLVPEQHFTGQGRSGWHQTRKANMVCLPARRGRRLPESCCSDYGKKARLELISRTDVHRDDAVRHTTLFEHDVNREPCGHSVWPTNTLRSSVNSQVMNLRVVAPL